MPPFIFRYCPCVCLFRVSDSFTHHPSTFLLQISIFSRDAAISSSFKVIFMVIILQKWQIEWFRGCPNLVTQHLRLDLILILFILSKQKSTIFFSLICVTGIIWNNLPSSFSFCSHAIQSEHVPVRHDTWISCILLVYESPSMALFSPQLILQPQWKMVKLNYILNLAFGPLHVRQNIIFLFYQCRCGNIHLIYM